MPASFIIAAVKKASLVSLSVALLRGINVGGKSIISMAALKTSFESLGFSDVKTYINSGNVIFRSKEKDARKLEEKLETMLKKEYGLKSRVMIRSLKEMERVVQTIDQACGDDNWKHNVLFLSAEAEKNNLVGELVIKEDIEKIVYTPGVLIWSAKKTQTDPFQHDKALR